MITAQITFVGYIGSLSELLQTQIAKDQRRDQILMIYILRNFAKLSKPAPLRTHEMIFELIPSYFEKKRRFLTILIPVSSPPKCTCTIFLREFDWSVIIQIAI